MNADNGPDENLVTACQKGDKAAYRFLVKRHYKQVFAMCMGILGNVHDAEDIAQDAMLQGFLKIRRLRRNEHFGLWILRIARNLCIDLLRRKRHVKAIIADEAVSTDRPANERYDLHEAVRSLPLELRMPLIMYYFDNKSTENIAEKLNISRSGVCQRIKTARKKLHGFLT